MAKTIMITEEVYSALSKLKHSHESYTDLLARLSGVSKKQKSSLMECAGLWDHLSDKDIEKRKVLIKKSRENWRKLEW